jgi:hypothetical protein
MANFDSTIQECRRRLCRKRRLAGLSFLALTSFWSLELGFAASNFGAANISALLWLLSIMLILASITYVLPSFGKAGDPSLELTVLYLDQVNKSGSLLEAAYESRQSQATNPELASLLTARAEASLSQVKLDGLVPVRPPRGFELGLALAFILALLIASKHQHSKAPRHASLPGQSLLSQDPELVVGKQTNPDDKGGPEVKVTIHNTKSFTSAANADKEALSDTELSAKLNQSREAGKDKDAEGLEGKSAEARDVSANSQDKASAGSRTARGHEVEGSSKKGSGVQSAKNLAAPGSRQDFKGQGAGGAASAGDRGAADERADFRPDRSVSSPQSAKALLSWRMRQTLHRYFKRLNEEKQ